jgi:hypothetical protein
MSPKIKTIITMSIWLLFIKGILLIPVTFYTIGQAYISGESTPLVGILSCAAGTFAFISACIAAWIRKAVD